MGRKSSLPVIYKRAGSNAYWCRFTFNGKRYLLSTGKCEAGEAEATAQRIYGEVSLGQSIAKHRRLSAFAAESFEQLAAEFNVWADTNKSPKYADKIEQHMRRFSKRWQRLPDATRADAIERYKTERLKDDDISTVTLHKELVTLSQFFKWCKTVRKVLRELPEFERIRPVSDYVPPNLSREQVDALLSKLPDRFTHRHHHAVRECFTVQWAQGMRPGQVSCLRWSDIDFEKRQIFIRQSNDKARSAGRFIAMDDIAYGVLKDLAEAPHLPTSLIFGAHDFGVSLENARKAAGLDFVVTPHHLRHARLTELASVTRDTAAIQALAGHKSLATTDRYVRSRVERQASVFAVAAKAAMPQPAPEPPPPPKQARQRLTSLRRGF